MPYRIRTHIPYPKTTKIAPAPDTQVRTVRGNFTRRFWSKNEDDMLRGNAGRRSYKVIGNELGRTEQSVIARARYLGLTA